MLKCPCMRGLERLSVWECSVFPAPYVLDRHSRLSGLGTVDYAGGSVFLSVPYRRPVLSDGHQNHAAFIAVVWY